MAGVAVEIHDREPGAGWPVGQSRFPFDEDPLIDGNPGMILGELRILEENDERSLQPKLLFDFGRQILSAA